MGIYFQSSWGITFPANAAETNALCQHEFMTPGVIPAIGKNWVINIAPKLRLCSLGKKVVW